MSDNEKKPSLAEFFTVAAIAGVGLGLLYGISLYGVHLYEQESVPEEEPQRTHVPADKTLCVQTGEKSFALVDVATGITASKTVHTIIPHKDHALDMNAVEGEFSYPYSAAWFRADFIKGTCAFGRADVVFQLDRTEFLEKMRQTSSAPAPQM